MRPKAPAARRATPEETNAAITAALDELDARREAGGPALAPAADAANAGSARALAAAAGPPAPAFARLRAEGWTADVQRAFLVHLADTGCVRQACAHVGRSRQSAYALRRRAADSMFALGWDAAIEMARQALLDEATERALAGTEHPVWHRGQQVGTRIVHNDRLLMFLLARKPAPAHPRLDTHALIDLWPAMLDQVDVMAPPLTAAERLARLGVEDWED